MSLPLLRRTVLSVLIPCLGLAGARAEETAGLNMIGNQSQNTGLQAVPTPKPVTIDGKLDEWDLSGRMWSFSDINIRDDFSVETAAMWDKDYLYLAFKWRDRTPMQNPVNPKYNPTEGWKSDAIQFRIKSDAIYWATAWHYTAENTNNLVIDRLKNPHNDHEGMVSKTFFGKPGETDLGDGVAMAFDKIQGGYVQEMRIPWKLLFDKAPEIQAGFRVPIGFEFIWGGKSDKPWPLLRYADNMQPGRTDREFFFRAQDTWGDVELMAKGNLPLRQYRPAQEQLSGPFKIKFALPLEAKRFTAVIDDAKGKRVRNLLADRVPADFAVSQNDGHYQIEAPWDGRDDLGKPVPPGEYKVRGLWHTGLDAIYDYTFANPGTPPWDVPDGSGSWGSNHCDPKNVAAAGDWMIVSYLLTEGGSGIIGINPEGRKRWGELRGSDPLAASSESVIACLKVKGTPDAIFKLAAQDGKNQPFVLDGKERPFPLSLTEILGEENPRSVTAMAIHGKMLALALDNGELALLDTDSAKPAKRVKTGALSGLAYAPDGTLYAISGHAAVKLDATSGAASPAKTPGLEDAAAITTDRDGNLLAFDAGKDQQVKAFSPEGKLVYTAGKKGGRPIRGAFDPEAMSKVSSVAVDGKGQIWVAEFTLYPRRVSVWGRDGKLVRDYIGGTAYAGSGTFLYDEDPSIVYDGANEFKLSGPHHEQQQVTQILWKADETRADEPKTFDISPNANPSRARFRSNASGTEHEYLFKQPTYFYAEPNVLFMEGKNGWRPVAAIGLVGQISGSVGEKGNAVAEPPTGEFAGLSPWDGFFWNDENGDGRVQRAECQIVPYDAKDKTKRPQADQLPIPLSGGWTSPINQKDLSFLVASIYRYKPLRYTRDGAPIYGPASIEKVGDFARKPIELTPVPEENLILGLRTSGLGTPSSPGDPTLAGIDAQSGELLWNYPNPFPGVHGSHKAVMPKPGLIIGPLRICGVAKVNDEVGRVFSIRGNLGQDFFFTTDGLNIGALFRDCRYPGEELPDTVADIQGKSLAAFSEGGEPFSGWFGKMADGKIREATSIARNASLVVQITGLESIRRFTGPTLNLTAEQLKDITLAEPQYAPPKAEQTYAITKVTASPLADERAKLWKSVPPMALAKQGFPERGSAQIAYDAENLYLRFQVQNDASPWLNEGSDFRRLFKTGDAVDFQIGPAEPAKRLNPGAGDERVVISMIGGQPVAVLMRPVDAGSTALHTYSSPVGQKKFARVEKLADAQLIARATPSGYTVQAAIPLKTLGLDFQPGAKFRGDAGFLSSDQGGHLTMARTYWANDETGLVNDEPQEAWLYPAKWGIFTIQP